MSLPTIWFILIGALLVGYAVLDGFDLGVGILHPFSRGETERDLLLESIAPFWDGNEVWLVVFGGAMFSAFPEAYSAAFTAFYLPFMLLLIALIFRGVAIEFRRHADSSRVRLRWDFVFSAASVLVTFCYGLAVGNSILGLPIGPNGEFEGQAVRLLHPYSILIGLFSIAVFAMHGSMYLLTRLEENELRRKVEGWGWKTFWIFLAMYLFVTAATLIWIPGASANFRRHLWVWLIPLLNVLAIANVPRSLYRHRYISAFLSSSGTIAAFTCLFGVALYPNLIASSLDRAYDLTVFRAASSDRTLVNLLIAVGLGLPFVLSYTFVTYWVFRGKAIGPRD